MNFENVKLLSYEHKNNFWGDSSLRYGSTVSISINGYILNLSNSFGAKDIFNTCKALSDSLGSNQDIIINGVNYGEGKIKSVTFDSGNWVKVTEYNVSIEIPKPGNLVDILNAKEFDNNVISSISTYAHLMEEFSESYSIDYSSNEDSINGSHSIDIRMSSLFNGDKIVYAKNLAQVLFSKTFTEKLSEISYKKPNDGLRKDFYSENYDTINGKCGFNRTFSYANTDECFSRQRSISVSLADDGITTVSETNKIAGKCLEPTLFASAELGFSSEITGSFNRCSGALDNYKTFFNIQSGLIPYELKRSVKRNTFNGEIEYDISFSNDPRKMGYYYYEYTLDLSRQNDFIWNASEAGSIRGSGIVGTPLKFNNATDGWNIEKSGVDGRVSGFYADEASIKPTGAILNLTNKTINMQPYDGVLSYNFSYTDDLNLDMSSDIRRTSISLTDSKPVKIHNDFVIVGGATAYSVAQDVAQSKQGEIDIKCDLDICSLSVPFVSKGYIDSGVSIINTFVKNYVSSEYSDTIYNLDGYIDSMSFSSDEIEQTCNLNAKFKYSKAAS